MPRLLVIALVFFASSCASTATISARAGGNLAAGAEGESASAALPDASSYDEVRYCEALGKMDLADISVDPELIDEAVAAAPPEHQDALRIAADMNRNPDDMSIEDLGVLLEQMPPILTFANERCGVVFAGTTLNEDGSISIGADPSSQETIEVESTTESNETLDVMSTVIPVGPGSEPPRVVAASNDEALAAVNAAVPAKAGLTFAWMIVAEEDEAAYAARVLAPVGWEMSVDAFGVSFENDAFGFFTDMQFGSGCQGICLPQEWVKVMDDPGASPFAMQPDDEVLIVQELTNPAGRLVVTRNGIGTSVELTRWSNDADKFFVCEATLDEDDEALWPAFADACIAAEPAWF